MVMLGSQRCLRLTHVVYFIGIRRADGLALQTSTLDDAKVLCQKVKDEVALRGKGNFYPIMHHIGIKLFKFRKFNLLISDCKI